MNDEILEEIKEKYKKKVKRGRVEGYRQYQLELIGKLRTKYYTLRQSDEDSEKRTAYLYMDEKISIFFSILRRSKRKLTEKEVSYLEDFFCNAPPVS